MVSLGSLVMSLIGCAAFDRVRPQALSPEDTDLSSIEYSLVLMSVDIHQLEGNLRLDRLCGRQHSDREQDRSQGSRVRSHRNQAPKISGFE